MQRIFGLTGALLASLVFASFTSGCAFHRPSQSSLEAPEGKIFLSAAPNFEAPAFFTKWGRPLGENAEQVKIRYLLERMKESEYRFIRNGRSYDGRKARTWCLYKFLHWATGVRTAKDFIERVATYSQKTGRPYLVGTPDGKTYSLRSILRNELSAFETYHGKLTPLSQAVSLPPSGEVSLPSPIVTRPTT